MYFCQLIKKSYLSFAPIHSPWLETEQVRERVSPMFTGFETALIEEYPGLSERKGKIGIDNSTCIFWLPVCVKRIRKTKNFPLLCSLKCSISYLYWLYYVSFIYLLLKNLWTYKPINMWCNVSFITVFFYLLNDPIRSQMIASLSLLF